MKLKIHSSKFCFTFLVLLVFSGSAIAKDNLPKFSKNKKGSLYFYFGYNRALFSKSDIHFSGPNYDFTLYDLEASDRPVAFGASYANPRTFSVPQYNYRLGYFFTNRFSLSFGMDHMKYVVNKDQMTTISGVITPEASTTYAGTYLNQPIQMKEDLLQFEHTNGFNFLSLDAEYLQPIYATKNQVFSVLWNVGLGGVFMITKTDVRVMGDGLDNRFHLSGYSLAGKTGPRFEFYNRFFISGEIKGGYASLPSVLIKNSAPERADHNLSFLEYYMVAGVNFRIGNGAKSK